MKSFQKFFYLFAVSCFVFAPVLLAQDDAQTKAWQEYMTPGRVHEMMGKSAGDWKTETKMWMDPNGQPMSSEGSCTNEMILGGRFMKSTYKGKMMDMPFEGMGLIGYDNATNDFTMVWIDNTTTGTMVGKGKWDTQSNSINFTGTMVDPMSKKEVPFRQVLKIVDDSHQVLELYGNGPDGKEYKSLEVSYSK